VVRIGVRNRVSSRFLRLSSGNHEYMPNGKSPEGNILPGSGVATGGGAKAAPNLALGQHIY